MSIAILGAGILGACTALELADRGYRITIFERNAEPLSEASLYAVQTADNVRALVGAAG